MGTTLFCFSATGNSLTTAKMLASELGDCRVVGMASLWELEEIPVRAEIIGFVFPIYYGDMPFLMRQVLGKMKFEGNPYIFSVCTYRGYYGEIARRLDTLLREKQQKLSFSAQVSLPGNSRVGPPEQSAAFLAAQKENVQRIAQKLKSCPVEDYRSDIELPDTPVRVASNMRGLEAEENCVGCGLCVRLCPMDNIRIRDGRAIFGDSCCTCLSCFHWCPRKAIWMPKAEEEIMRRRDQYRHPDITLEEILALKTG